MGSKFSLFSTSTGLQVAVGIFIIGTTTSFFAGILWQRSVTIRKNTTSAFSSFMAPDNSSPTSQRLGLASPFTLTPTPFPPASYTPPATSTPPATPTTTPTATDPSTLIPTSIDERTVLIHEIAWAGTTASSYDEWIELYNPSPLAVNLTGWRLTAVDGSPDIHLSGVIISGGYFLLERTDDHTISDISSDIIYTGSLKNTGETLHLLDPTGKIIDTANITGGAWPAGESSSRASMERKGSQADSLTSWGTNTSYVTNGHDIDGNAINGTPKQANSIRFSIPTATYTISSTTTPTPTATATTTYTATVSAISTNTATATITVAATLATLPTSTITNTLTQTFTPTYTAIPSPTASPLATATNSPPLTATNTSIPSPTATATTGGQLVLNEILADPASGANGDANGDGIRDYSQDEFIEIVNNSSANINISNWVLEDSVTIRHIFPEGTIVPAHCSIIIFGGGTPTGIFGGALIQTSSTNTLSLNNAGGDTVALYDASLNLILTYTYGDEGNDNQSITRSPDISGSNPMVKHSTVSSSLFSPGTKTDGSAFSGCNP